MYMDLLLLSDGQTTVTTRSLCPFRLPPRHPIFSRSPPSPSLLSRALHKFLSRIHPRYSVIEPRQQNEPKKRNLCAVFSALPSYNESSTPLLAQPNASHCPRR